MNQNKYTLQSIRAAAILTTSYVAWTVLGQTDSNTNQELNQLVLYIDFTIWSLTSVELKIEFSDDWVNFYQQVWVDISWWTATCTALEYSFDASWSFELATPMKAKFVRVSSKGTWTVTSSSLTVQGILWIT